MTYETGDDTPPDRIERLARAAAVTLMEALSETVPGGEAAPAASATP